MKESPDQRKGRDIALNDVHWKGYKVFTVLQNTGFTRWAVPSFPHLCHLIRCYWVWSLGAADGSGPPRQHRIAPVWTPASRTCQFKKVKPDIAQPWQAPQGQPASKGELGRYTLDSLFLPSSRQQETFGPLTLAYLSRENTSGSARAQPQRKAEVAISRVISRAL